jgi:signal transduction histidine kinase
LNNLLAGAQLQASLAIQKLPSENPAAPHIGKVMEAMDHMARFVDHLLLHARGEQLKQFLDLNDLASSCINVTSLVLGGELTVALQLSPDLPGIYADKVQLQQLIINLLLNAAESLSDNENHIVISTGFQSEGQSSEESGWWVTGDNYRNGPAVFFKIEDYGAGIANEALERIFNPFYTTKEKGSGLGLPLILEIVQSHNGRLLVRSQPGQGTTFKVFFPVNQSELLPKLAVMNGCN